MKKSLIFFILIFIQTKLVSQNDFPKIEKITTNERMLHGYLAKKYPITIYLKLHKFSGFHRRINKLKGWYYYDKIKTKIPLVGISGQDLILYQLKDENSFFNKDLDNRKDVEEFENIADYTEKFIISKDESKSKWFSKGKELRLFLNLENTSVIKESEFLHISKERTFPLNQFRARNFNLLYANKDRFLLEYSYGSKANVMGHCGAGNEEGFLLLVFDENGLKEFKDFPTESCLDGIYAKKLNSTNTNEIIYEVSDSFDKVSYKFRINKSKIDIKKMAQ